MLRATGEVVRFEAKPWKMDDGRTGVSRTARLLIGRCDFADVVIPETMTPRVGDMVDWAVTAGLSFGKIKVAAVGDFATVVPQQAPALAGNGSAKP